MTARILIIEDDEPLRRMMRQTLEGEGYDVEEASDGKEGLRRFLEASPDLVITDMVMPTMDGIETIRELRRLDEKIPVIAMSGGHGGWELFLAAARKLGAEDLIEKPFERAELLDKISRVLESHER